LNARAYEHNGKIYLCMWHWGSHSSGYKEQSPGIWCLVIWQKFTHILKECTVSIFKFEGWAKQVATLLNSTRLHGITSQRMYFSYIHSLSWRLLQGFLCRKFNFLLQKHHGKSTSETSKYK
jgi:hypothetical protein